MRRCSLIVAACAALALTSPALAQRAACHKGASFEQWLDAFKREAVTQGISPRTIAAASHLMVYDQQVVNRDRGQKVFSQTFLEFSDRMVARHRIDGGIQRIAKNRALFSRIEQQYGVPGSIVIAIWGLETGFGVDIGKTPVIRSLATLAHDCRRSAMFQGELLAALQIVARGDLSLPEMRGAWAGELGQAQFLPSNYVKFAVDFDGNGRRDLIHSVPDTLASIANLLKSFGWAAGGGYREGSANFSVLVAWNKATIYQRTIAAFAARLDGG